LKLSEIISRIQSARAAHKAWVARAEGLVAGLPLEKEQVPVLPTDCIFGQWYYGPGQMLRRLPAYKALERPHDELHKTYMKIFQLLFDEPDIPALSRLFGQAGRARKERRRQAEALLPVLRQQSEEVCALLDTLEDQVIRAVRAKNPDASVSRTL
jgi:hypothetical protein